MSSLDAGRFWKGVRYGPNSCSTLTLRTLRSTHRDGCAALHVVASYLVGTCSARWAAVLKIMDSEADLAIPDEAYAAYNVCGPHKSGPQCSQSRDWCFFCEYSSNSGGSGDIDLRGTVVTLVNVLQREKRELAHIVDAVHERYHSCIQQYVEGHHRWGKASIRRHLLYSTEFAALFEDVVTHVFQTIIHNLNENMVDEDGRVLETQRRAFVDTVKAYQGWERTKAPVVGGGKRKRSD